MRASGLQVKRAVNWSVPQPVLIGTVSLEDSETLYGALCRVLPKMKSYREARLTQSRQAQWMCLHLQGIITLPSQLCGLQAQNQVVSAQCTT